MSPPFVPPLAGVRLQVHLCVPIGVDADPSCRDVPSGSAREQADTTSVSPLDHGVHTRTDSPGAERPGVWGNVSDSFDTLTFRATGTRDRRWLVYDFWWPLSRQRTAAYRYLHRCTAAPARSRSELTAGLDRQVVDLFCWVWRINSRRRRRRHERTYPCGTTRTEGRGSCGDPACVVLRACVAGDRYAYHSHHHVLMMRRGRMRTRYPVYK